MFGCKQRGAAAQAAQNVFYPLTYADEACRAIAAASSSSSPAEAAALADQAVLFGQTPSQLFSSPHPPRGPPPPGWRAPLSSHHASAVAHLLTPPPGSPPATAVYPCPGGFVVLTRCGQTLRHGLVLSPPSSQPDASSSAPAPPFVYTPAPLHPPTGSLWAILGMGAAEEAAPTETTQPQLPQPQPPASPSTPGAPRPPRVPGSPSAPSLPPLPGHPCPPPAPLFCCSADGSSLFSAGAPDGTLSAHDPVTSAPRLTVQLHAGCVTALACSPCGRVLVAGAGDCTLSIYLLPPQSQPALPPQSLTCGEAVVSSRAEAVAAAAEAAETAEGAEDEGAAPATQAHDPPSPAPVDDGDGGRRSRGGDATTSGGGGGGGGDSPSSRHALPRRSLSSHSLSSPARGGPSLRLPAALAAAALPPPPPPPLRGPLSFLRGCPEPPAAVAAHVGLDAVAAACPSFGTLVWSLCSGRVTRRIPLLRGTLLAMCPTSALVCVYDPAAGVLRCASINGELLSEARIEPAHALSSLAPSADGAALATGCALPGGGGVALWALPSLRVIARWAAPGGAAITALAWAERDAVLVATLSTGGAIAVCG